jgi:hypothetical protein
MDVSVWDGDDVPEWYIDINGKKCLLDLNTLFANVVAFTGNELPQRRTLCTLTADLSRLRGSLRRQQGLINAYYEVAYEVVVKFGGTQLQATIHWMEGVCLDNIVWAI